MQSSWDNVYDSWSDSDLRSWLKQHGILAAPKSTRSELLEYAQEVVYAARDNVQGAFESASESAIESWNDSQLREFLLQHGIVAPHSGREQLLVLAQRKQREIQTAAAKMYEEASKSISSAYGDATVLASDAYVTASRSAHSKAAEAVKNGRKSVARLEDSMSDASDFVYSTWEDNRIRVSTNEKRFLRTCTAPNPHPA